MKEKRMSIELFSKLLQNDSNQEGMLALLRELTKVKETRTLSDGIPEPGPMGTWAGWSL